jgi:hypothetical protein
LTAQDIELQQKLDLDDAARQHEIEQYKLKKLNNELRELLLELELMQQRKTKLEDKISKQQKIVGRTK